MPTYVDAEANLREALERRYAHCEYALDQLRAKRHVEMERDFYFSAFGLLLRSVVKHIEKGIESGIVAKPPDAESSAAWKMVCNFIKDQPDETQVVNALLNELRNWDAHDRAIVLSASYRGTFLPTYFSPSYFPPAFFGGPTSLEVAKPTTGETFDVIVVSEAGLWLARSLIDHFLPPTSEMTQPPTPPSGDGEGRE